VPEDATQSWHDKQEKSVLNLFKLRVGVNHKKYPEFDVHVLIIF
jgi:hypothetical protein